MPLAGGIEGKEVCMMHLKAQGSCAVFVFTHSRIHVNKLDMYVYILQTVFKAFMHASRTYCRGFGSDRMTVHHLK